MKSLLKLLSVFIAFYCMQINVLAQLLDEYNGVELEAKFIGGQQYEPLYNRISDWEELTGAKVKIISKKSHFEIDREIKSDIAAGTTDWCVGYNHTSFAPQYENLYIDLNEYFNPEELTGYTKKVLESATIDGKLTMIPRAQFDISILYYLKSNYQDEEKAMQFEKQYGYSLNVPETWNEVKDQAIFFADPPNFYGTQFAGKDEAIVGRFYELLIAEGGQYLNEDNSPAFHSEQGQRALQWFIDLYQAKAVPSGTISYVWDDLGQGFASGSIALNLDWIGWSEFFNDKESSAIADNVGVALQPMGSVTRTGWSGTHGFSITQKCANKDAAASLIAFLTNEESQVFESANGSLPTRDAVWDINKAKAKAKAVNNNYRSEILEVVSESVEYAFPVPKIAEWGETVSVLYPQLQAAILGDKTAQQALDDAAEAVNEIMEDAGYY